MTPKDKGVSWSVVHQELPANVSWSNHTLSSRPEVGGELSTTAAFPLQPLKALLGFFFSPFDLECSSTMSAGLVRGALSKTVTGMSLEGLLCCPWSSRHHAKQIDPCMDDFTIIHLTLPCIGECWCLFLFFKLAFKMT